MDIVQADTSAVLLCCVYLDECVQNVSWLLFNDANGVLFLIGSLLYTLSQWLIMCE